MQMDGWWNIYVCDDCVNSFAISQEKDEEVVYCPQSIKREGKIP
jgi:hypothetical protein